MIGSGCMRAGKLLAGRRAGLGEAERLWLEHHLQDCERCRADARALDALARLAEQSDAESIGERGLARAVSLALRESSRAATPVAPRPWARIVLSFSIVAAAATAGALAWVSLRARPAAPQVAVPSVPAPAPASALPPAPPVAGPHPILAGQPVQLAHAEVLLDDGSAATWDGAETTVRLAAGRVSVHVDPTAQRRFRVATDRFVVEVTGTRFEVATDSVEVFEGSVRVLALDGLPLAERLAAGGRWQVRDERASVPLPAPPQKRAAGPLLEDARGRLARGDAAGARRLVARALDAEPGRAERAEAETLLAEAMLVEGDRAGAAERYARVFERYGDLPAGENALYAAASAAARAGRSDEALALAERYLQRYPRGRFRADAATLRDRLRRDAP